VGGEQLAEDRIGTQIIDAAMAVHSALGPGLLENTYEICLAHEISKRHLRTRAQVSIPLRYGSLLVNNAYRVDLLVDDLVVVEIKAVETTLPVRRSQLLSYLRLGGFKLGYLLNFNVAHMRNGIVRRVNGLEPTASSAHPLRPPR
jgi:GxxExxY protein